MLMLRGRPGASARGCCRMPAGAVREEVATAGARAEQMGAQTGRRAGIALGDLGARCVDPYKLAPGAARRHNGGHMRRRQRPAEETNRGDDGLATGRHAAGGRAQRGAAI